MPLRLLGIVRNSETDRRSCDGIDKVRWLIDGDLVAAITADVHASMEPLEHARLLEAIHRSVDVLPVRFGTTLKDDAAVRSFLDARRETLRSDLERLAGATEFGLRIELPATAPSNSALPEAEIRSDGAGYLAARRARYDGHDRFSVRAQAAIDVSVRALQGLCRNWRRLAAESVDVVRLAFLVRKDRSDAFTTAAEKIITSSISDACPIRKDCANIDSFRKRTSRCWTLVGPWPPYSFA